MQKASSIAFTLLASLAILAHAFVPHHHIHHHIKDYDEVMDILDTHTQTKSHLSDNIGLEKHNCPYEGVHHHHDSGTHEDCMVCEACLATAKVIDNNRNLVPDNKIIDSILDYQNLGSELIALLPGLETSSLEHPPRSGPLHSKYIGDCVGMRAPPTC